MSVEEQDVVMMKEEEEGCGSATVVPMLKIEGCGIVPAALSPSERASGILRDVNSTHHRAGLERAPNTHTTLQS